MCCLLRKYRLESIRRQGTGNPEQSVTKDGTPGRGRVVGCELTIGPVFLAVSGGGQRGRGWGSVAQERDT